MIRLPNGGIAEVSWVDDALLDHNGRRTLRRFIARLPDEAPMPGDVLAANGLVLSLHGEPILSFGEDGALYAHPATADLKNHERVMLEAAEFVTLLIPAPTKVQKIAGPIYIKAFHDSGDCGWIFPEAINPEDYCTENILGTGTQARAEGWQLSNRGSIGVEIQAFSLTRPDRAAGPDDLPDYHAAWRLVVARAAGGSVYHKEALRAIHVDAQQEMEAFVGSEIYHVAIA